MTIAPVFGPTVIRGACPHDCPDTCAWQVTVADGSDLAAEKLARVLTNDPGTGVMRHVDAGYEHARDVARERGLKVPML